MQSQGIRRVIVASSVGTVIEFYDFFIFASLASTIAAHFFPPDRPTLAFMSTLATYGIGLAVRPFGSLAFGRLGDTVGRRRSSSPCCSWGRRPRRSEYCPGMRR
jgi:MFS family permease